MNDLRKSYSRGVWGGGAACNLQVKESSPELWPVCITNLLQNNSEVGEGPAAEH